jgi:hypothetical protein
MHTICLMKWPGDFILPYCLGTTHPWPRFAAPRLGTSPLQPVWSFLVFPFSICLTGSAWVDAGCGLRFGCYVPAYGSAVATVVPAVRYNANWACEINYPSVDWIMNSCSCMWLFTTWFEEDARSSDSENSGFFIWSFLLRLSFCALFGNHLLQIIREEFTCGQNTMSAKCSWFLQYIYSLYYVTLCSTKLALQEPIKDTYRLA